MANPLFRCRSLAALAVFALVPLVGCTASELAAPPATATAPGSDQCIAPTDEFAKLECTFQARLGVYALDTGTNHAVNFRAEERFPFASTSKALLAAIVLQTTSDEELNQEVRYTSADLIDYSPITERNITPDRRATSMTLRDLCDAAIRYSDNTASNLLFRHIGGPAAFQAELRKNGDEVTLSERTEPELNTAIPGETRDTSTPQTLALHLKRFSLDESVLSTERRGLFNSWLKGNTTGNKLIRAGIPAGWTVGDKTGSADYGTRNDIAVIWPDSGGAPIVMVVLSTRSTYDAKKDDKLIADATKVAFNEIIRKRGER